MNVINYCDELLADPTAPPKKYWVNTSGNDLIIRLLKKADQVAKDEVEELVKSNAETGEGYSDISIQTPERTGIVIELKYADNGSLESACTEALKQIEIKKYAEGLKHRGMKKIVKYGMAFCEKASQFLYLHSSFVCNSILK